MRTLKFKYGFEYKGFNFGWNKKKLFRLPSEKKTLKNYPLKELSEIKIGNKKGYRIVRDKKTIVQLMEKTKIIDYTYTVNGKNDNNCPF